MTDPRKSSAFEALFAVYVQALARHRFAAVHIRHAGVVQDAPGSVLLYANHVSWWDGLLFLLANRRYFHRQAYVLMSEDGLLRFPFFRRLGAFPVPQDPRGVLRALRYGASRLSDPRTLLLYFPQGLQRHQQTRPLGFADGIGTLLSMTEPGAPIAVVPAALHYTFLEAPRPEAFLDLGVALADQEWRSAVRSRSSESRKAWDRSEIHALTDRLEMSLTQLLDRQQQELIQLDRSARRFPDGYEPWPRLGSGGRS
ncbi:MAG: lysophospholipid acyltransferase family protein [Firmicutes bacterium]|nr:lysophospholipid acyltransferase family protein [Bacillota bacterium]